MVRLFAVASNSCQEALLAMISIETSLGGNRIHLLRGKEIAGVSAYPLFP